MSEHQGAKTKRYAVAATVGELEPGKLRVVLDDLVAESEAPQGQWRRCSLFTHFDVDRERAVRFELLPEQYARIGELLLARLVALSTEDE